ncbi:hypothetical protein AAY473_035601 [Plecturocebus cupreus]
MSHRTWPQLRTFLSFQKTSLCSFRYEGLAMLLRLFSDTWPQVILQPRPPKYWDYRCEPPPLALDRF